MGERLFGGSGQTVGIACDRAGIRQIASRICGRKVQLCVRIRHEKVQIEFFFHDKKVQVMSGFIGGFDVFSGGVWRGQALGGCSVMRQVDA